jgi:hypothetical protein
VRVGFQKVIGFTQGACQRAPLVGRYALDVARASPRKAHSCLVVLISARLVAGGRIAVVVCRRGVLTYSSPTWDCGRVTCLLAVTRVAA